MFAINQTLAPWARNTAVACVCLFLLACQPSNGSSDEDRGAVGAEGSSQLPQQSSAPTDLSPSLRDQRILVNARLAVAVDRRIDLRALDMSVTDAVITVSPLRALREIEQTALQDALGTVEGVVDIQIEERAGEAEMAEGSGTPPDIEPEELDLSTLVALADPEERLPDPAPAAEGSAGAPAAAASGDRPRTYRVRSGDSLSRIAARTMNDGGQWRRLYEFNRAVIGSNPERLREGMELRIPQD